jgi:stress-induced morphogen
MLSPEWIRERVLSALPDAQIEVIDTTGTNDHFEARVISEQFAGMSMVRAHQMVYAPLKPASSMRSPSRRTRPLNGRKRR